MGSLCSAVTLPLHGLAQRLLVTWGRERILLMIMREGPAWANGGPFVIEKECLFRIKYYYFS